MGLHLIAFSGEKRCAGRNARSAHRQKDLVSYALLNNSPHEDNARPQPESGQGRTHRHGQGPGILFEEDHDALNKDGNAAWIFISSQVTKIPGVTTSFPALPIANHVPHMHIKWDPARIALTPREATTALRGAKPSIDSFFGEHGEALSMKFLMLQAGEEKSLPRNW